MKDRLLPQGGFMGKNVKALNKVLKARENIAAANNREINPTTGPGFQKLGSVSSASSFKKIKSGVGVADIKNQQLDSIEIENASQLIKYRQNITVPAVWIPQQGVRAANLGIIPAENIFGLDTYITDNVKRIDGGDLDNPI